MTTASWSEGYDTGAGYTHGYYKDLNPRFAAFALTLQGLDGPPPGPCCELGFGQGLSLAIHAAGDPTRRWWGCDFMPEHAARARTLIDAAGVEATLSDQSFEAFFARSDLPQFAFIGLHGVWSWVSPANRARIVSFLDRHLMPGGVVYLSYNCMAGWAAQMPLRTLVQAHARRASPPALAQTKKLTESLAFLQRLCATDPMLVTLTPALTGVLSNWETSSPSYLVHELLHDSFYPMDFTQVAADLGAARLTFAVSSELHERRSELNYSKPQRELLDQMSDATLRELVQDTLRARPFRREYWVRGPRPLTRAEAARRVREQRVVLAMDRADVPALLTGTQGTSTLPEAPRAMLLDMLEQAESPLAIDRILETAAARRFDANTVVEMVATWVGAGALMLVPAADEVDAARPAVARLNEHLIGPRTRHPGSQSLASPLSGGGFGVSAAALLTLGARAEAPGHPERWAPAVWAAMQAEGHQMHLKGGERVGDLAAAQAILQPLVQALQGPLLQRLRRLGVVD